MYEHMEVVCLVPASMAILDNSSTVPILWLYRPNPRFIEFTVPKICGKYPSVTKNILYIYPRKPSMFIKLSVKSQKISAKIKVNMYMPSANLPKGKFLNDFFSFYPSPAQKKKYSFTIRIFSKVYRTVLHHFFKGKDGN